LSPLSRACKARQPLKIQADPIFGPYGVFAVPAANTFGNVGRNAFKGPGFANVDLSIFRRFAVTERIKLEFRVESFNFTNTPQYPNPDGGFGNATFGQITSAAIGSSSDGGSRQIQLGLRLQF
jgi:hypothetical protein